MPSYPEVPCSNLDGVILNPSCKGCNILTSCSFILVRRVMGERNLDITFERFKNPNSTYHEWQIGRWQSKIQIRIFKNYDCDVWFIKILIVKNVCKLRVSKIKILFWTNTNPDNDFKKKFNLFGCYSAMSRFYSLLLYLPTFPGPSMYSASILC